MAYKLNSLDIKKIVVISQMSENWLPMGYGQRGYPDCFYITECTHFIRNMMRQQTRLTSQQKY